MNGEKAETLQGKGTMDKPQVQEERRFMVYKVLKQISLVGTWFCLGMMLEIVGPTLPDLKDHVACNYEEISRALVAKSAGLFVGAMFGGVLHEKFNRHTDLIMSFGILFGAVGIAMVPWIPTLPAVAFFLMLTGISEGFINTGGNAMVMHIWRDKAASPMHSLHFGFAVGAIVAPQIARGFLSPDIDRNLLQNATVSPEWSTEPNRNMSNVSQQKARLEYTYTIIGGITLVFAVIMFLFYLKGQPDGFPKRKHASNFRRLFSPATCAYGHFVYGLGLLTLLFLYFIQAVGGERAYGKFLFSFAIETEVAFSKHDATTLNSVFWACHMAGRGAGILVAHFVPIRYMIAGDLCGSLLTTIVLSIFGYRVSLVLWIMSSFMGVFISILFPSGMSWANLNMQMNSMAVMVLMIGSSCGGFIYHYLPGYLFEYVGPHSFMYVMVAYSVLTILVFSCMELLLYKKGRQIVREWQGCLAMERAVEPDDQKETYMDDDIALQSDELLRQTATEKA